MGIMDLNLNSTLSKHFIKNLKGFYRQFFKTKETEGTLNVLRRQSCNPDFVYPDTHRVTVFLTNRTFEDILKSYKPDIT